MANRLVVITVLIYTSIVVTGMFGHNYPGLSWAFHLSIGITMGAVMFKPRK
jgi:hypothetical protein